MNAKEWIEKEYEGEQERWVFTQVDMESAFESGEVKGLKGHGWQKIAIHLGIAFDAQEERIKILESVMQEFIGLSDRGLWPTEVGKFREKFKQLLGENNG